MKRAAAAGKRCCSRTDPANGGEDGNRKLKQKTETENAPGCRKDIPERF